MKKSFQTTKFQLPSGSVIEFESIGAEEQSPRGPTTISTKGSRTLEAAISPLVEGARTILQGLRDKLLADAPSKVSIELYAALKGGTNWVFVNGETQGSVKVTLTWERDRATDGDP